MKDIYKISEEDLEMIKYEQLCVGCPYESRCHQNCETCEDYENYEIDLESVE